MTDANDMLDQRYRAAGWLSPNEAAWLRHRISKSHSYCAVCLYTIFKTGVKVVDPEPRDSALRNAYPAMTLTEVLRLLEQYPTYEVHSMDGQIGLYAATRFNGTLLCAYCTPSFLERRM